MKKVKDETTKQKILEVATTLFAQKGFNGTSIRDICKTADVNLCLISYYWGGKQELFNGIINDLIERQSAYAKTFLDLDMDLSKLSKKELIDLLFLVLDKFVDFFYSEISSHLITLLLDSQQKNNYILKSPAMNFIRSLIATIFEKNTNDRKMVLKTIFIMGQINSPRVLSSFTLSQLEQNNFTQADIKIIKENLKLYVKSLLGIKS